MPRDVIPTQEVTAPTGNDRLLILAAFLEGEVTHDRFDMEKFNACALAWATEIPAFRQEGLTLSVGGPLFQGAIGFDAGRRFFNLDLSEAGRIFHPVTYAETPTPAVVALRIRSIVAARQ